MTDLARSAEMSDFERLAHVDPTLGLVIPRVLPPRLVRALRLVLTRTAESGDREAALAAVRLAHADTNWLVHDTAAVLLSALRSDALTVEVLLDRAERAMSQGPVSETTELRALLDTADAEALAQLLAGAS
jgi:hypothetical protein